MFGAMYRVTDHPTRKSGAEHRNRQRYAQLCSVMFSTLGQAPSFQKDRNTTTIAYQYDNDVDASICAAFPFTGKASRTLA